MGHYKLKNLFYGTMLLSSARQHQIADPQFTDARALSPNKIEITLRNKHGNCEDYADKTEVTDDYHLIHVSSTCNT